MLILILCIVSKVKRMYNILRIIKSSITLNNRIVIKLALISHSEIILLISILTIALLISILIIRA